ncbi:hypothetical protein CS022_05470 [Veronia nyctiphanis]|uniref:Uncharacterized protein n=1 Tax=Veronia nyctiphanis TaxID=1278244 RepID=A0A4Q0YSG2_9GAMM|nr:hypothetical protein [Veronia nyctiphanis]RXJ74086.1 hypothetical protein CS022_05470 [Veronia nyctiphanis]
MSTEDAATSSIKNGDIVLVFDATAKRLAYIRYRLSKGESTLALKPYPQNAKPPQYQSTMLGCYFYANYSLHFSVTDQIAANSPQNHKT